MNAFHSIWTEPVVRKKGSFTMKDFEVLVMMLSALAWRLNNGKIKLYTDKRAVDYYCSLGITELWDEIRIMQLPDVEPIQFWAAGKLQALSMIEEPEVMIDTDLIVWKTIDRELCEDDISVMHREKISEVYPGKEYFEMNNTYKFKDEWNWNALPCNTALLYINGDSFRDYYTSEAFRFMKNRIKDEHDFVKSMVFAEQRLLSMCAAEKGKQINALLSVDGLDNQDTFTHIWGYKRILQSDTDERKQFCKRCLNRIEKDFPEFYQTALKAVKM